MLIWSHSDGEILTTSCLTGESERNLRQAFQAAAEAAAEGQSVVLFLDECDAICPPRDPARPHESRVTSQLLGLLDALSQPGGGPKIYHLLGALTHDLKIASSSGYDS